MQSVSSANTTAALGPAVDWSATFDPSQPGGGAPDTTAAPGNGSSPDAPNSWLPAFPSDLFYPSVTSLRPYAPSGLEQQNVLCSFGDTILALMEDGYLPGMAGVSLKACLLFSQWFSSES